MGTYQYALRSKTLTVDGIEIASYTFAYKRSWDWQPGNRHGSAGRQIAAIEAVAEKAAYKNRHVRHVVGGPFKRAAEHAMQVYLLDREPPADVCEGPSDMNLPVVGYLVKRNGRYHFEEPVNLV